MERQEKRETRKGTCIAVLGAGAQAKYACENLRAAKSAAAFCVIAREGSPEMTWPEAYKTRYLVGYDRLDDLAGKGLVSGAIPCAADPDEKAELLECIQRAGLKVVSAIHPAAVIASTASIGEGVIINPGAVIQPFARIGRGVMIHAGVIVEHDCRIEDFANLAPSVALAGWVQIGRGAVLFTNASVIPGRSIGAGAVVAAGATVTKDVPPGRLVGGTPARPIDRRNEDGLPD